MNKIGLIWRTIRHLTARQLMYQVVCRLRGRGRLRLPKTVPVAHFLAVAGADRPVSWVSGTVVFLNISHTFAPDGSRPNRWLIDWNLACHGKLWTYNLNYFDFLNQAGQSRSGGADAPEPELSVDAALGLIHDFMTQTNWLTDGLEPYPTSLRIGNWVRFLSRNKIHDAVINRHLYAQAELLSRRLEYHIGGNHLLENGFALLMAALYFRQGGWLRRATRLVRTELTAQIMADGGHNERSPIYHQLLLDRLLDVWLALAHNTWQNDTDFHCFLTEKVRQMLGWLEAITFRNGDVPMMNDAAFGIAPTTAQLRAKATTIARMDTYRHSETIFSRPVSAVQTPNPAATGYRKFTYPNYELVADAGDIGPDHQPGHGHADTFSFVLYVDNCPLIVDNGTSTYTIGPRRAWERSTAAHNTVDLMGLNSSEVWAGFRAGRRARVTVLTDTPTVLMARHDGYRNKGVCHERTWLTAATHICITDRLRGTNPSADLYLGGVARLHFHPDRPVTLAGEGISSGVVRIMFASASVPRLRLTDYYMADGFNRLRPALCVEITFTNYLETLIIPTR